MGSERNGWPGGDGGGTPLCAERGAELQVRASGQPARGVRELDHGDVQGA